ncbi:MAG: DUF2188 domain-containing protein [Rhodospirillales bacterium]
MKIDVGKSYTRDAKQALKELNTRIAKLKADQSGKADRKPIYTSKDSDTDWNLVVSELQTRAREVGDYVEELTTTLREIEINDIGDRFERARSTGEKRMQELRERGEKQLSEVQARVESGIWDIRAALQRASEGIEPLMHLGEKAKGKTKYFLQHSKDGRWALIREGAKSPTQLFATKGEGLRESRRYVRDRRPSILVIRRADGTFEHVHKYAK